MQNKLDLLGCNVIKYNHCSVLQSFLSLICREAYKQLQREKEQEVAMLKEQNQRLQVQLNNTQVSLHDLKEKTSQHIQELESHVSLLERKVFFFLFSFLLFLPLFLFFYLLTVEMTYSHVQNVFISSYVMYLFIGKNYVVTQCHL